jgi:DNA-binding transcriptional LysR family regulator
MNLNQLAVFHAVAEEGSISRGAARLFVSQPAVSKQVRELETSLGVTLFDRLPRGLRLTEAGRLLAGHARRLFAVEAEAERAIAETKGLSRGRLVVGASLTIGVYLLPEILGAFRKRHPQIGLELEIANTRAIQQQLLENAFDVAFTEGLVEDPQLEAEVFRHDELVAVACPDHPLLSHRRVTAERFCQEPFLMREKGSGTRAVLERALAARGLSVQSAMSLGSTEAIKRAIAAGLGVGMVSHLAVREELASGKLVRITLTDLSVSRPLHMLRLRGRSESIAAQALISLVRADAGT